MSQIERLALARKAQAGDQWKQIKSGRIAIVVTPRDGSGCVMLEHENGRVTRKWEHYFAEQYEPTGTKAAVTDTERLDWILEHCVISGGGDGLKLTTFIPHDSEDVRDALDQVIRGERRAHTMDRIVQHE